MGKESFLIYKSFYKPISKLSDKQLGRLFRAIFKYQLGEEVTVEEDIDMAFEFFKSRFELDESKYHGIVERNRNNGRKAGTQKVAEDGGEDGGKTANCTQSYPVGPICENTQSAPSGTQWDPVAPSGGLYDNDSDNDNDSDLKEKSKKKSVKRFSPPTIEEVKARIAEMGYTNTDPERFVNFYGSKGWMVGKNKMKDWKAALANWNKEDSNGNKRTNTYGRAGLENHQGVSGHPDEADTGTGHGGGTEAPTDYTERF